jgi:hypothetical protein
MALEPVLVALVMMDERRDAEAFHVLPGLYPHTLRQALAHDVVGCQRPCEQRRGLRHLKARLRKPRIFGGMRRLYFLVPDASAGKAVVDELLLAHVEWRHIHVVAKRGTPLGELPDASFWQKSDIIPAMLRAVPMGGGAGILCGLVAVAHLRAGDRARRVARDRGRPARPGG